MVCLSFFFCLSGSEAVENAVKMARLYTGRSKVICPASQLSWRIDGGLVVNGGPTTLGLGTRGCGAYCGQRTHIVIDVRMVSRPIRVDFCRAEHLEHILEMENPDSVAAIVMEGITGPMADSYRPMDIGSEFEKFVTVMAFC